MAVRRCLAVLALISLAISGARAADIAHYIAAEVVDWDFAPSGKDLCHNITLEGSKQASWWSAAGTGRILRKARFLEYTGPEMTTLVERPPEEAHLALLGPLIRAQPGDTITITFTNRVSFPLRLDPAGLTIEPSSANATTTEALGPVADPGATVTYIWSVPEAAAPCPDDPSPTKLYLYLSTIDPTASDNAGLIGPILVGRNSSVFNSGRDVITVLQIVDENASPFLEANLAGRTPKELGVTAADLEEGLLRHSINGRLFCNLESLRVVQGEETRWHFAAVGTEEDIHTAHLHGNTWLEGGHRADQVSLFPGSVHSVALDARSPGTWLMHCHVADHITAGMMALYTVFPANSDAPNATDALTGKVRRYYVAAEEVEWDYAPLGGTACAAAGSDASTSNSSRPVAPWTDAEVVFTSNTTGRVGSVYLKARYVEYTDGTFTKKKEMAAEDGFLGILGPLLRAEVGDTLEVVFLNRLTEAVGCHPHGVEYNKSSESAPYADGSTPAERADDAVSPGANVTLTWHVPDTAGPGSSDPSTIAWLYHSHTNEISGPYAGLVGAIIVGRAGAFSRNSENGALGAAVDADIETVAMFAVMDERQSYLWPRNVEAVKARDAEALSAAGSNATASVDSTASADAEAQLLHSINGYIFCNGPELQVRRGSRLRLHILAIGTEVDLHSPTIESATLEIDGQRGPAAVALPGSMQTVDISVTSRAGPMLLQCRVADHIAAGMKALVRVIEDNNATAVNSIATTNSTSSGTGVTRSYAIQAEETLWDYVGTTGKNACPPDAPVPFTDAQKIFVEKTNSTIGSSYTKAVYSRYENSTFDRRVPVPGFHGLLGPVIAAEVGDVLNITFRNALGFAVNLRLDGGFVPLEDSANPAAAVPPNATVAYRLLVPPAAGPGPADLNTVTYGYGSSVDYSTHPMAGLVGMVLVGAPGAFAGTDPTAMPADPVPAGTGGLLPIVAAIFDENESPFLGKNAEGLDAGVAAGAAEGEAADGDATEGPVPAGADFYESNLKHSLNGYLFCNAPRHAFDGSMGAPLRVAVLALGSETDVHSILIAGHVIQGAPKGSPRGALEPLLPAVTMTADLSAPLRPGVWPIACAVHDHADAGMQAQLEIKGAATSSAVRRSSVGAGAMAAAAGLVLLAMLL